MHAIDNTMHALAAYESKEIVKGISTNNDRVPIPLGCLYNFKKNSLTLFVNHNKKRLSCLEKIR